jgi:hypothetical protein
VSVWTIWSTAKSMFPPSIEPRLPSPQSADTQTEISLL